MIIKKDMSKYWLSYFFFIIEEERGGGGSARKGLQSPKVKTNVSARVCNNKAKVKVMAEKKPTSAQVKAMPTARAWR